MVTVSKTQVIRKMRKMRKLLSLLRAMFRMFRIWETPRAREEVAEMRKLTGLVSNEPPSKTRKATVVICHRSFRITDSILRRPHGQTGRTWPTDAAKAYRPTPPPPVVNWGQRVHRDH